MQSLVSAVTEPCSIVPEFDSEVPLFSGRLTGVPDAQLWWTAEKFGRLVVWELGYKWAGWPANIPFQNLSDIPGGAQPLKRLQKLWKSGELKLVPASGDERMRALHDPESVMPNPSLPSHPRRSFDIIKRHNAQLHELAHQFSPAPNTEQVQPRAVERVLHPLSSLAPVFELPLGSTLISHTPSHSRRQRSDINRSRGRPVTKKRPKHPKRGPHTAPVLVASASEWKNHYLFVDDHLEAYNKLEVTGLGDGEPEDDEIESADDWV